MNATNKLDNDEFWQQIVKRNLSIDALKDARKHLLKGQKEYDGMLVDGCHAGNSTYLKDGFAKIITEIDLMIKTLESGDWCFSVESTKEREGRTG